jgi:glycosyltransferase involved in cell wall biosynthesis
LPTIGVQALLAARIFRVPVVFRAIDVTHRLVPSAMLVPVTKLLERFIFNRVDLNIALTPHLKKYILSYGTPEHRVRLLPSGVDCGMFSPGSRNSHLMAQWGITPEDQVILFMGTIYRFSGLDRVIGDFSRILERHPNAKLLIVGPGEDEDRLRALAQTEGVTSRVVFTGAQPYSILPDVIRSSTVCINPFELNGVTENILPTKLFQYMTCEKPVVATPLPGTCTFLSGEDDGIVYAPLERFNEAVISLLGDQERLAVLGRNAGTTARQYDWQGIARNLVNCLNEVI